MRSDFCRGVVARAPVWLWPAAVFALTSPQVAAAPAGDGPDHPVVLAGLAPEQVYVWGQRQETIGLATSASEGRVSFAEFQDRPILRPGELVEVIPGLAVTQHSGTGKANQYFLRGFNLDHGTDFSVSFDGVPLNLPSHGHGQGYLDLNAITPEFIEVISFRKGPYFADVGDFSSAGTAALESFTTSLSSFAEFTGGKDNFYRVLGMAQVGDASYIGGELAFANGPWVNPENLEKINVLGRLALGGNWSLTALAYSAQWDSTDQIPVRAIDEGLIPRLGTIDPTDGGETSRYIVALRNRDMNGWDAVAHVQRYELSLWSNFTYFLDDPVNGDQFEQADERWIFGGSVAKTWENPLAGWTISTGAQIRGDEIDSVGLYNTVARERINTVREDNVSEWAGALWAEGARSFGPVRAVFGLRADAVGVNVSSDNPLNSGSADDFLVSPKLALAWRVSKGFELYANAGRGFHSNDARGATATVSPKTGDPADPVNLLSPSSGGEVGFRWDAGRVSTTATAFYLHLDSELVYVGDAGETEATSASQRFGGELLFTWRPIDRIDIDLSAAATHARLIDAPGADHIPNALEYVFTGGISALVTDELIATLTFRLLGPAPLTEDGRIKSETAFTTNFLLRYRLGRFTFTGQILNLLNNADNDIQYFLHLAPSGRAGRRHRRFPHPSDGTAHLAAWRADYIVDRSIYLTQRCTWRAQAPSSILALGDQLRWGMTENRHIRRRIAWERARPRAHFRFRAPHMLVAFFGLLALALQSLVVQTHVHIPHASTPAKSISFITLIAASAGLSDASLGHTDGQGQYPANRDSTTCPWCKELTRSGPYASNTSVLTTLPFPVTLNVIVFREIAPSLFAASHTWRGRAPPIV